jgi:hypothetical protein
MAATCARFIAIQRQNTPRSHIPTPREIHQSLDRSRFIFRLSPLRARSRYRAGHALSSAWREAPDRRSSGAAQHHPPQGDRGHSVTRFFASEPRPASRHPPAGSSIKTPSGGSASTVICANARRLLAPVRPVGLGRVRGAPNDGGVLQPRSHRCLGRRPRWYIHYRIKLLDLSRQENLTFENDKSAFRSDWMRSPSGQPRTLSRADRDLDQIGDTRRDGCLESWSDVRCSIYSAGGDAHRGG